jgi:hypothetical protein
MFVNPPIDVDGANVTEHTPRQESLFSESEKFSIGVTAVTLGNVD